MAIANQILIDTTPKLQQMQTGIDTQAVELARHYARDMNAWEQAFEQEWRAHSDTYVHGASEEIMAPYRERDEAIKNRHREMYRSIFQRYATEKTRKYGGPDAPLSAGFPTKYSGIKSDTKACVEVKSKSRIEVTFDGHTSVNDGLTRFIILRVGDEWRIDSFKYKFEDEEKWINGIL